MYFELFDEDTAGLCRRSGFSSTPWSTAKTSACKRWTTWWTLSTSGQPDAEQVNDVTKISEATVQLLLVDRDLRFPQIAEQLVEVPTVLSFASLQEQFVERSFTQWRSSRFSPRTESSSALMILLILVQAHPQYRVMSVEKGFIRTFP